LEDLKIIVSWLILAQLASVLDCTRLYLLASSYFLRPQILARMFFFGNQPFSHKVCVQFFAKGKR
jgi:hypothetical protein